MRIRRHQSALAQLQQPPTDRLRVLVVTESFLPQVNGVTNSVRRVLEHLAAEGHQAELVAPTGPPTYAGFPVTRARGTSLSFYRDFRIGLDSKARLRAVMARFAPDVVHVASPATLGHQAVRAAEELGIPTVAIYQTDLVGFAERYDIAGGPRAMAYLTRRIHAGVDRTLAPSSSSLAQLADLGITATALWPRGVDLQQFHPVHRSPELRRQIAPDGRLLIGYVGRLAPEKELDLLTCLAHDARYALVIVGGGPRSGGCARCSPGRRSWASCTARSSPGRTPRSTSSSTPVATRPTASRPRGPWRRASPSSPRAPAVRSTWSPTAWPASSTSRATAPSSWPTSTRSPPTGCSAGAPAWRRAAASRPARGRASTRRWSPTTAT